MHFVIVNANEDYSVIAQQVFGKEQPGIHHAEPVAVIVTAVFAVFAEQALFHQKAFFILLADALQIVLFFSLNLSG